MFNRDICKKFCYLFDLFKLCIFKYANNSIYNQREAFLFNVKKVPNTDEIVIIANWLYINYKSREHENVFFRMKSNVFSKKKSITSKLLDWTDLACEENDIISLKNEKVNVYKDIKNICLKNWP